MKGKKIFRKIIVSVLILTMVLSNVTVAADLDPAALDQVQKEYAVTEEEEAGTVETPADTAILQDDSMLQRSPGMRTAE